MRTDNIPLYSHLNDYIGHISLKEALLLVDCGEAENCGLAGAHASGSHKGLKVRYLSRLERASQRQDPASISAKEMRIYAGVEDVTQGQYLRTRAKVNQGFAYRWQATPRCDNLIVTTTP